MIGDSLSKMIQEHSLTTLFHTYAELEKPPILELRNIDNKPVGALYMSNLKYKNFVISETNNSEKYYLYIDGVGIYFSFFSKINL
jgi:hypothetical protein